MHEINLLHDSRGRFYDFPRAQRVLLLILLYLSVGGIGVLSGQLLVKIFRQKPIAAATETTQVYPSPPLLEATPTPQEPSAEQFQQAEEKIGKIAQVPIKLVFKTKSENIEEVFESEQIKSFLKTSIWENQVLVVINNENFDQTISEFAQKIDRKSKIELPDKVYEGEDRVLDQLQLEQILRDEIFGRREGRDPCGEFDITHLVPERPGSDGDLADKYLEVDLSQQRLYRWEGGKVVGKHIISTGKYGPTPRGLHKIKNKALKAWSPPAQVWMPFWMAYAYNPNLGAYLGFHELPYWEGASGEKIRRPFDTLGTPVTGGCIQLNIGDAEEVYNWTEIGIPVLIHE